MSTAARVLTPNCRNENAMELFPSRRWSRRRPYLIKFIQDCAPSVIGVQECTNNMAAEKEQIKLAITLIEQQPDHERVAFFGDFNSVPTNSSVRKIASNAGYQHLRAKLSPTLITWRTCNTFNGWKLTKRESEWIDDVLISPTVKPYATAIMLTDSSRFPVNASDHNGVFAKVQFSAAASPL